MLRLEMKNWNMALTEKQQKYQHYHPEKLINIIFYRRKILLSDQRRIKQQAKFANSPLGKAFEKQTKTIEQQGKKQVEPLEDLKPDKNKDETKSVEELFPKRMRTNEINNELDEIKKWEEKTRQ